MNANEERLSYSEYETVPMGEYEAICREAQYTDGEFGRQVEFLFELMQGENTGVTLKAWSSAIFSNKSKLYKWATNVLGEGVKGNGFAPSDMIGQPVKLEVLIKDKDDGTEYNRIENVRAGEPSATQAQVELPA